MRKTLEKDHNSLVGAGAAHLFQQSPQIRDAQFGRGWEKTQSG